MVFFAAWAYRGSSKGEEEEEGFLTLSTRKLIPLTSILNTISFLCLRGACAVKLKAKGS